MKNKICSLAVFASAVSLPTHAFDAFDAFEIKDIRLEGLQRISVGTVFTYLPVKVGDKVNRKLSSQAVRALYKTGFFKDVRLEREGDILVVFVAERPAISDITINGNSDISSEQLDEILKGIGLTKGKVFNRSVLDTIEQELRRQYHSLGKYGVKIDATTKPLERNRVQIEINIAEGEAAEIYTINIVGNTKFTDEKLLDKLNLAATGFWGGKEQYSRQQLAGDLENLKSYYQDRGYINFKIDSTQVSLTPNKQDVYVTINITEGEKYKVSDVKLSGERIVSDKEIIDLISVVPGDIFSAKKLSESRTSISDRLAEDGYAFANVNVIPDVDKDSGTVGLTVFIDPGRRVYVRRINISGNDKTRDEVIRRELRQMEGDWMSSKNIAASRARLERLGFFETVSVETPTVSGSNDQVDVNYSVTERATGNLTAGIGYSGNNGLTLNLGVTQENFLGTGKRLGITLETSSVAKNIRLDYTNPYYTADGVSRGFSLYSKEVDAEEADLSSYVTNSTGLSMNYGIPLDEHSYLRFNVGVDRTEIIAGTSNVAQDILDFISENGSVYDTVRVRTAWSRDTRNRRIMADRGNLATAGADVASGDLEFYKLNLRYLQYVPLSKSITLSLNAALSYGDGYGDTTELPPFERYYAGGARSVRGFESRSLGPKDPITGDPTGGDTRIVANAEFILPSPFEEQSKSTRMALFFDGGYVYNSKREGIDLGELRYSAGAALLWLTPVGAMRFSYATPLNDKEGDEIENFQFTLGSPF